MLPYTMTGLTPNSNYIFRAVARNADGTTNGSWMPFSTLAGTPPPSTSKPSVTTNSATSITTTSAILNGTVNPNGLSTTAWFENASGATFGLINVGNGNNGVTMLPYTMTGLTPNSNYLFRAVAKNADGITNGSWMPFSTLAGTPPPSTSKPSVTTNSATGITTTSAILNGTVNPNGLSTTAWFETATQGPLGTVNLGNHNSAINILPYSLTGLSPNANYIYRAAANNINGTSYGAWVPFSTSPNPNNPTAPTLVSLSPSAGNQGLTTNVILTGTGFISGSNVIFSGSGININSTTINSLTSITVNISINSNATVGSNNVVVTNSNGTSNSQTFTVNGSGGGGIALTPNISSISPNSVLVNSGSVAINIYGSNFTNNSIGYFNGSTRSLNYVNSGQVIMNLYSSDTSSIGNWNIYVANNSGNNSNSMSFNVYSNGGGSGGGGGGGGGGRPIYYVSVVTQNSISITKNSATLSGSINPNNQTTTAWFEYGTSYNLATFNETTHAFLGSGGYPSPFTQNISYLNPNTTYYFRAVGNNYAGTIRGSILSFTTGNTISNIINNIINTDGTDTNIVYQDENTTDVIDSNSENTNPNQNIYDANYFSNINLGANAIFGFTGFLPNTFWTWLIFLILILLIIIIGRKLYSDYSNQKRKNHVDANHIDNLPV